MEILRKMANLPSARTSGLTVIYSTYCPRSTLPSFLITRCHVPSEMCASMHVVGPAMGRGGKAAAQAGVSAEGPARHQAD